MAPFYQIHRSSMQQHNPSYTRLQCKSNPSLFVRISKMTTSNAFHMALPCSWILWDVGEKWKWIMQQTQYRWDQIVSYPRCVCKQLSVMIILPFLSLLPPLKESTCKRKEKKTYQKYLKDHHVSKVLPIVHYCLHPFVVETMVGCVLGFVIVSLLLLSLANATKARQTPRMLLRLKEMGERLILRSR